MEVSSFFVSVFPVVAKVLTAKLFVAVEAEGLSDKRAKGCPATAWTFKERKEAGLFTAILPIAHVFRCSLYCGKTHNQLDCQALPVKTLNMS
jgi:hypothetical protein